MGDSAHQVFNVNETEPLKKKIPSRMGLSEIILS
jgi:hypothetical protein